MVLSEGGGWRLSPKTRGYRRSVLRIAVLADIHSNHVALEACLAEAKERYAEEFLFLGDYLGELAYPERTLELLEKIRQKYPCVFIRGNKEDYWINHKNGNYGDWVWEAGRSGSGMLAYVYDRLTREQIEQFEKMPVSMKMNYPGLPAFVICHGSPWKTNESMREDFDYIEHSKDLGDYYIGFVDDVAGYIYCG